MIKTSQMLLQEYSNYAKPYDKINRLVKVGELISIAKWLYETDRLTPAHYLAGNICGPSYLSFEFALSYYGLIPKAAYTFTSTSFCKRKTKKIETPLVFIPIKIFQNKLIHSVLRLISRMDIPFKLQHPKSPLR